MSRRQQSVNPCVVCSASVPRSTACMAICAECRAIGDAAFRRLYPYTDPISHQRNRNLVLGDREALVALIRSERAVRVAA